MPKKISKYAEVGVETDKRHIGSIFKKTTTNLFPGAFCVAFQDPQFKKYAIVLHTDGAGSKPVQSYLHYKESGDVSVFRGLAYDTIAMNIDDAYCNNTDPIGFVDYIAINKFRTPKGDVLRVLNDGFGECFGMLEKNGVYIVFAGGETADLVDQSKTIDVSGTVFARANKEDIITGRKVRVGDVIIGIKSGGRAKYEKMENSGIMCNGISLARRCLMHREYQDKYPEIVDYGVWLEHQEKLAEYVHDSELYRLSRYPKKPRPHQVLFPSSKEDAEKLEKYRHGILKEPVEPSPPYYGKYKYDDYVDELGMTVSEAILSPTRIFAPVVKKIRDKFKDDIHAFVHDTGSGQTKTLKVGRRIHYTKDNLPEPDPIFLLIQRESGATFKEMYQDYNMGIGFEVIVPRRIADDVLSIPEKFGIEAGIIGKCERSKVGNRLTVKSQFGKFGYR